MRRRSLILPATLLTAAAVVLSSLLFSPPQRASAAGTPAATLASRAAPAAVEGGLADGIRPRVVEPRVTHLPIAGLVRASAGTTPRTPVTTAAASSASFQTIGISWNPISGRAPALELAVRTRAQGTWSGWQHLEIEDTGDPSAPARGVRGGTSPLWVGPSNGVQARIELRTGAIPAGIRVDLIDPGSSPFDAQAGAGLGTASARMPTILSRAAWGADERRVRAAPTYQSTIAAGVLHHTAGKNTYTRAQVPGILRGDYAYHLSRGWNDIGYNMLVDRFGRIWEGRGGGVDAAVMGAHAGGFNTATFGVAVLGNLDTARPTPASVDAVARLMAWKLDRYRRDPLGTTRLTSAGGGASRYPAGQTVTKPVIMGHRDVGQTACPGRYLYPFLPAIRVKAAALMQAGLLAPLVSASARGYATGGLSVSARTLFAQTWKLVVRDPCRGGIVATASGRAAARTRFTAAWSGRGRDGSWARPGRYVLELTSQSSRGSALPLSSTVLLTPPTVPAAPVGTASAGAGRYVALAPRRLLDTRTGPVLPAGTNGRVDLPVLGRGGVPAGGVSAVVLAVAATCTSQGTALSVAPRGVAWGGSSARSAVHVPAAGLTRSSTVVVPLGAGGAVSVTNTSGVTDLIVDVLGYFGTSGGTGVIATERTRVHDSGTAAGSMRGRLGGGATRTLTLPALGGVASDGIAAVLANVTTYQAAGNGAVEVRPGTGTTGLAARAHVAAGARHDTVMLLPVSGGRLTLRSPGPPVHVAVDVVGVLPASWSPAAGGALPLTLVPPSRQLDTQPGQLTAGGTRTVQVHGTAGVPAEARSVLVRLTAHQPDSPMRVVAWPNGAARPAGTDLRGGTKEVRANLALVPIGADGRIAVGARDAGARVTVDVLGWL